MAVRPLLSMDPQPYFLEDLREFIQYLHPNYGDPDERGTARRKLKALRQTASALAYFAEFQQYIALLGWKDQDPIIDRAIDGLKSYLKDEMARAGHCPNTLSDLIRFIVPLDNRLYEREQEKKYETKNETKPQSSKTTDTRSKPIETIVSVLAGAFTPRSNNVANTTPTTNNNNQASSNGPRGPITNDERERRMTNNLCLCCGESGHKIADCPRSRNRNTPVQVRFQQPAGNGQGSTDK